MYSVLLLTVLASQSPAQPARASGGCSGSVQANNPTLQIGQRVYYKGRAYYPTHDAPKSFLSDIGTVAEVLNANINSKAEKDAIWVYMVKDGVGKKVLAVFSAKELTPISDPVYKPDDKWRLIDRGHGVRWEKQRD